MNKNCFIILPNQLFKESLFTKRDNTAFIIEEYMFFKQYNFHKQKISFHRATMKFYENYLIEYGLNVNVCIKPAKINFGIVFKRVDLKENNLVYPNFMNVTNTSLNTTVENEFGTKVSTIEHLMGALFGLGIDNALIEIDNEEVPILDGSAKDFIEKILTAGFDVSDAPIKIIKINKEIKYFDKDRYISIRPSTLSLDIDFEIKYNNKIIGNQRNKVKVYEDDLTDIYNSRTYCLYEDIELIKKNGLAKGGSLNNAIVVKDNEILKRIYI